MSFLFEGPTPLDTLALDTVVHVGAGDASVLDAYSALRVARLLLVEGDPDTAADLQAAAAGRTGVEVLAEVVAAAAGPVEWHRYNLVSLNGPLNATGLEGAYPRLRSLGVRTVEAVALDALLQAHLPTGGGPHVLWLDVPGQEPALLHSLPSNLLRRFAWIVLRSRGSAPTADPTTDTLRREGFAAVELPGTPEPLWPLMLWRFDEEAHRWRCLRDELLATEQARSALEAQLARQREAEELLHQSLSAARAESAGWERQVEELKMAADVMASDAQIRQSELEQQLASLSERLAALQREADEAGRQAQADAEAQRAAHALALASLQQQVQQVQADCTAAAARQAEDAAALAAERQAHETTRTDAQSALSILQQQAQAAASAAATEQAKLASTRDAALKELEAERAAHAQTSARLEQQLQQRAQAASSAAAAAQAELASARDAALKELEAERAAHAQTRAALQHQQAQSQTASQAAQAKETELSAVAQSARQDLAAQAAAHAKATDDLQKQLEDIKHRAHQSQERVALLEKARESLERQTAEREQAAKDEVHRANQAVALSLKLQMLREADLKELQGRYQGVLVQQKSQQDLLSKLAQRLTVANQYFHELSTAQQMSAAPAEIAAESRPRKRRARAKPDPAGS